MKQEAITGPLSALAADAMVVALGTARPITGAAAEVDRATGGLLARLLAREEVSTRRYAVTTILAPPGLQTDVLAVVGLGDDTKLPAGVAYRAAAAAARSLAGKARASVAWGLDLPPASDAVAGAIHGFHGQDLYRAEKKSFVPQRLLWVDGEAEACARGERLGESIVWARRLVNEPPNVQYPETLAEQCAAMAAECGLQVEIWDPERLREERCGALLAVAAGSARPARMVILRHLGQPDSPRRLGLVGKGVTFDSGGLSIKPSDSMADMKMDMAGAATVAGAMRAIALERLPLNAVAVLGCVENLPGGRALKLGDVLTARSGTTIEVLNTDAEGRLVLADALDVARQEGGTHLVDLATLTGACMVALGRQVAGVMSNDDDWREQVLAACRQTGEEAWPLPMFEEYGEQIKSPVADLKNVGEGRWGGAITAAKFLEVFAAGTPWTHLDIAGPAFLEKPLPWCDAGASGLFVRSLLKLAESFAAAGGPAGEPRGR